MHTKVGRREGGHGGCCVYIVLSFEGSDYVMQLAYTNFLLPQSHLTSSAVSFPAATGTCCPAAIQLSEDLPLPRNLACSTESQYDCWPTWTAQGASLHPATTQR